MVHHQDKKEFKFQGYGNTLSISMKLTICLVSTILIVVSIIQIGTYVNQLRRIHLDVQQKTEEQLEQTARILSNPVWNINMTYIPQIGFAFAQNDLIQKISISDNWDKVLYEFDKKGSVNKIILKEKAIEYDGVTIGNVKIWSSFESYEKELSVNLKTTLTILCVSILVVLGSTRLLLNFFLRDPLALLIDGINLISKGDYSFKVETIKQREFVNIAYKYGAMAQKVKSREDKLKTINRQLMQEVSDHEQTAQDLQFKNALLETEQEASLDGILAVDDNNRILTYNQRFKEMWDITDEDIFKGYDKLLLMSALDKMVDPDSFLKGIKEFHQNKNSHNHDKILLTDGRTFEQYSAPLKGSSGTYYGRVWYFRDITAQKAAQEQIKTSLTEKELLLKEVYHRVKNNMQVISSFLYFQSQNVTDMDTLKLFKESEARVKSMALIHEKLYKSDNLSEIDYFDYIKTLVSYLRQAYVGISQKIRITVEAPDIFLGIDTAIPCGLIINELVSNSLKHAFPPNVFPPGGEAIINIDIVADDQDELMLTISDNGVGFPQEFDIKNPQSLGMQIVNTLVDQLDGTLRHYREPETKIAIRFKKTQYNARI